MLTRQRSLQRDIWLVIVLLTAATVVGLAIMALMTSERLEHALLQQTVTDELNFVRRELAKNPNTALPHSGTLQAWLDADERVFAPAVFHTLPTGQHHSIDYLNRQWQVLRADTKFGKLTVAADVSLIEHREQAMVLWFIVASALSLLISSATAWWFSRRLAHPAQKLASLLQHGEPEDTTAYAPQFDGVEFFSIASAADELRQRNFDALIHERLFSAAASHELRTPLSIVTSSLELLAEESISEGGRKRLSRARRATKGLAEIIDSLIHLARPNSNETLSPEQLVAAVKQAVRHVQQRWPEVTVNTEYKNNPIVHANHELLRVVINNLLKNSAQHGLSRKGETVIRVEIIGHILNITDNGPGLPKIGLDEILQPYVSHESGKGDNFGLGLYIVHRICLRHGWQLSGTTADNGGACMTVDFQPDAAKQQ